MSKDPLENKVCSDIFTTEPGTRRHLYGLTATRKRATLLMELLFQNGFVSRAPYQKVKEFVEKQALFIGLDPQERTITGYIGRPVTILTSDRLPETHVDIKYKGGARVSKTYTGWKKLREKVGLCHKLGWMEFDYAVKTHEFDDHDKLRKLEIPQVTAFVVFNHKEVPLPYHLMQTSLTSETPRMGTSKSEAVMLKQASDEGSIDDLCVCTIEPESKRLSRRDETTESRERRVSKQHTQIGSNLESESIPQVVIVTQKPFLKPSEQAAIEERDRKRLEILDADLLQHLEKSTKKQP